MSTPTPSRTISAAVLSQVTPDGRAVTLTQGYLRVADASAPGPRNVAMRAICATVPAGAALRLSLQAASFPAFAVNPGTGAGAAEARLFDCRVVTLARARRRGAGVAIDAAGGGNVMRVMVVYAHPVETSFNAAIYVTVTETLEAARARDRRLRSLCREFPGHHEPRGSPALS